MLGLFGKNKDHEALDCAAMEMALLLRLRCENCPMYDIVDDCRGNSAISYCKQRVLEELYQDSDCHILSKTREFLKSATMNLRLWATSIASQKGDNMSEIWINPSRPPEPPTAPPQYPQDSEPNEYRYLSPAWLDAIAEGLTKGAVKHPGETWRQIPADEHLARAMRHINLYRMGDRSEPHMINASMRLMMAFATEVKTDA